MHDHNDNSFSMMMWMMAICCLGPLIIIFFAGRASGRLSAWLIIGALAVFVGAHLLMHRGHGHQDEPKDNNKNLPDQPK